VIWFTLSRILVTKEISRNSKESRRAFARCEAIFNKQNQLSIAADMVKRSLGKYLKVPNATK